MLEVVTTRFRLSVSPTLMFRSIVDSSLNISEPEDKPNPLILFVFTISNTHPVLTSNHLFKESITQISKLKVMSLILCDILN